MGIGNSTHDFLYICPPLGPIPAIFSPAVNHDDNFDPPRRGALIQWHHAIVYFAGILATKSVAWRDSSEAVLWLLKGLEMNR